NPEIVTLMQRGDLDGAWVPEPWVARLEKECDAEILVDERTLWPGGRFPTAVLVAGREALAAKREALGRLVAAQVDAVRWIGAHPDEARTDVARALRELAGKALPDDVMAKSFARVEPIWEPMPETLGRMAEMGRALKYLPAGDLGRLVDRSLLDAAL